MLAAVLAERYIMHIALNILVIFFSLKKIKSQKLCTAEYNHGLLFLQSALEPKKDCEKCQFPQDPVYSQCVICLYL